MVRLGAAAVGASAALVVIGSLVLGQVMGPGAKAHVEADPDGRLTVDLAKNVSVLEGNPRLVYEGENQRGTLAARKMTFKMAEKVGITELTTEGPTSFDWTMPGPARNGQPTQRRLTGGCSRGAKYEITTDEEGDQAEMVTLTGDAHCKVETLPDPGKYGQSTFKGEKIIYNVTKSQVATTGAGEKRPEWDIILPAESKQPGQ